MSNNLYIFNVFNYEAVSPYLPTLWSSAPVQGRIEYGADLRKAGLPHERRREPRRTAQRRRRGRRILMLLLASRWLGHRRGGCRQIRSGTLATPSSHSGLGNCDDRRDGVDVNSAYAHVGNKSNYHIIYDRIQYRPMSPILIYTQYVPNTNRDCRVWLAMSECNKLQHMHFSHVHTNSIYTHPHRIIRSESERFRQVTPCACIYI